MNNYRIVELSHHLLPGQEEYQLEVATRYVDDLLPEYERAPGDWYVMSEVSMWSHVGTHMEAPYHYLRDGQDCAEIPVDNVVGECVLIDFTDKRKGDPITLEDLEGRAQCIQEGDIVFLYTGLSRNYRTRRSHDRPYLPPDAVLWLVERGIACLGVDCSGIEERGLPEQPSHRTLLEHGIPLIEHLTHLDRLTEERFFVVAVPWRVRGLDASPVSVVAFESE